MNGCGGAGCLLLVVCGEAGDCGELASHLQLHLAAGGGAQSDKLGKGILARVTGYNGPSSS